MAQADDLRDRLEQQHAELCSRFESLHVCQNGGRCQRIHRYDITHDDQLVKMMDYIIGVLKEQSKTIKILESKVDGLLTHFNLDKESSQMQGKSRASRESTRMGRQMSSRSKSSERYSQSQQSSRASTPPPRSRGRGRYGRSHYQQQPFYPNPYAQSFNPPQTVPAYQMYRFPISPVNPQQYSPIPQHVALLPESMVHPQQIQDNTTHPVISNTDFEN
ncbi:VP2 [Cat Tien Hospitalitermes Lispi-like virus]|uniref:VP2 n=1 Tax=Cat Tien Hospitalitermes Lispi-like virus TaxID=2952743 RepID=A0AAE9NIA4_9MONO|nr:VP2 [Cat Tien Hospitalitermes Lispi-like virus]